MVEFSKTERKLLTTTSPEGVYLGTTLADITSIYKVVGVHILEGPVVSLDLSISYDSGSTWHAAGTEIVQMPEELLPQLQELVQAAADALAATK